MSDAYRRVTVSEDPDDSQLAWDQATGEVLRVTSAAFMPHSDGLSANSKKLVDQLGAGPGDVRNGYSQIIVLLLEPLYLENDLSLSLEPEETPGWPISGETHALLGPWPDSLKGKKRIARNLAEGGACVYPSNDLKDAVQSAFREAREHREN